MNTEGKDFLATNLEALAEHRPMLHQQILEQPYHPPGEFYLSASGDLTIRLKGVNKETVMAYGMTNPWQDAAAHLDNVPSESRGLVVWLGIGLGYGPLVILRERPAIGKTVILEPQPDLFQAALRAVDLRPLIENPKVDFFVGNVDMGQLEKSISRLAALEDTHILRHVASFHWDMKCYTALDRNVFMLANRINASGGTTRKCGQMFFKNRLANLSLLPNVYGMEPLQGLFAGKPAVLVAAGPSLDRSLEDLKRLKGRSVIFAVDSALAPLLAAGIEPDFVTSIDYLDLNFEKFAPFLDQEWSFSLVVTPKLTPLIPKRMRVRHLFIGFNDDLPHQWMFAPLGVKTLSPPAFSVAHLNLGLAIIMGADPIVLVAQDLAYTTASELDHATGTIIARTGLPRDREIFHVKALDGSTIPTDRGLMALQVKFEEIIQENPGKTYINASVAGVEIRGTTAIPLAKVCEQYMGEDVAVHELVDAALLRHGPYRTTAFLKAGHKILADSRHKLKKIKEIRSLAKAAVQEVKKLQEDGRSYASFGELPQSLSRRFLEFDTFNNALDTEKGWGSILELTYPALNANDHRRDDNAQLRKSQGFLAWALAEFDRIEAVNEERGKALVALQSSMQNLLERLEREEQLRRSHKGHEEAMTFKIAQVYRESDDLGLAIKALQPIIKQDSPPVAVLLLAADISAGLFAFDDAELYWSKARLLEPACDSEILAQRHRHADFWIRMADEHGNAGEEGDNFPHLLPAWFERIIKSLGDAEPPPSLGRLWEKHQAAMESWMTASRNDLVDTVLAGWRLLAERMPEVLAFAGKYANHRGEQEQAIFCLEKALSIRPREAVWLSWLARALLECGRFDEGLAKLGEAVALNPATATLWEEVGDLLVEYGDQDGAIIAYEKCFIALPERVVALCKMGDCYMRKGQTEAARAAWQAALTKDRENPIARARLGNS